MDFFFTCDDFRYLASGPVEKEQLAFGHAEIKFPWSGGWTPALALEYSYQDQVLDVSIRDVHLAPAQIQGQTLMGLPSLRWDVSSQLWSSIEYGLTREYYAKLLDDDWETGPKLTLGLNYGHQSTLTVSYESLQRNYDSDPRRNQHGSNLTGRLAFNRQDLRLAWQHCWDETRFWRTMVKAGFKSNRDNGGGYFDYDKTYGAVQLLYRRPSWEALIETRAAHYDYRLQRIANAGSPHRARGEVAVRLRAEKTVAKQLKIFAEYEHESTFPNDRFEEYKVNVVTAGCNWIF